MALVTVAPSGGDYTSLSAAEAGEQQDLTALGDIMEIECEVFEDTTAVTIDGWTTSATFYLEIKAAAGAHARMPWSTSAYRLKVTTGTVLTCVESNVRFTRLQWEYAGTGLNNRAGLAITATGTVDIRIDGCFVRQNASATGTGHDGSSLPGSANTGIIIRNTVVQGWGDHGILNNSGSFNGRIWSNTVTGCGTGIGGNNATNNRVNNNLVANCTTDFSGNVSSTSSHNASEDTTAPGSSSRVSQTFTFVDAAGGDFHLASGDAGAKGFGVDLSGDATHPYSTDFDADARGATWDIGADQYVAAPGGSALLSMLQAHGPFLGSAH